jgi:hypothetical protein
MGKTNTITITEKQDSFEINAAVHLMGRDVLVVLSGGMLHIGAIGIGQPRPSLKDEGRISSTGSVFTFPGHKEDVIAKSMSEELARRLNRKTVVVAGIHWDKLITEEVDAIMGICNRITEKIIAGIEKVE